jgi:hypothetical protein
MIVLADDTRSARFCVRIHHLVEHIYMYEADAHLAYYYSV